MIFNLQILDLHIWWTFQGRCKIQEIGHRNSTIVTGVLRYFHYSDNARLLVAKLKPQQGKRYYFTKSFPGGVQSPTFKRRMNRFLKQSTFNSLQCSSILKLPHWNARKWFILNNLIYLASFCALMVSCLGWNPCKIVSQHMISFFNVKPMLLLFLCPSLSHITRKYFD